MSRSIAPTEFSASGRLKAIRETTDDGELVRAIQRHFPPYTEAVSGIIDELSLLQTFQERRWQAEILVRKAKAKKRETLATTEELLGVLP
jgi:hypothetical protein